MKKWGRVWAIGGLLILPVHAWAQTTLVNPSPISLLLLQARYSATSPDYKALVETLPSVQQADEFHKAQVISDEVKKLQQTYASYKNVSNVVINLDNSFEPYDSDNDEYDFDIDDGTYISYTALGRSLQVDLTNGTASQSWQLSPQAAQTVLDTNGGNRQVVLVLNLHLEQSPPPIDGQTAVLNASIISYDVLGVFTNQKLGHVDVSGH